MSGVNPFDRYLSQEIKEEIEVEKLSNNFQGLLVSLKKLTQESFNLSNINKNAWKQHQKELHKVRLNAAASVVPLTIQKEMLSNNSVEDSADDQRFAWIDKQDEILQLRSDEDFLRASRSWERRQETIEELEEESVEPLDKIEIPGPTRALQIWRILIIVLFSGSVVTGIVGNILGGLILIPFFALFWAFIYALPDWMQSVFDGSARGGGAV